MALISFSVQLNMTPKSQPLLFVIIEKVNYSETNYVIECSQSIKYVASGIKIANFTLFPIYSIFNHLTFTGNKLLTDLLC